MPAMKYRHARVVVEGLPLLEATEASQTVTTQATWVETADPGLIKSVVPPKVEGSLTVQIPRTGQEYDYLAALKAGSQLLLQWVDADGITSARVRVVSLEKSDRFAADRTCTVRYDGYLV